MDPLSEALRGDALLSAEPIAEDAELAARQQSWMRLLVETTDELTSSLQIDDVLAKVADRVKSLVNCQVFCVLLWNERKQVLESVFSKRFDEHFDAGLEDGFPLGFGISGSAAAARAPVRVADVRRDPRYVHLFQARVDVRSELAVPLLTRDRLVGVLDLESSEEDAFTAEHERMLMALGSRIAVALENARLYEEVSAAQQRLADELAIAREVQKALLPARAPVVPHFEIGFTCEPARMLGGDLYDFLAYPDGRLALCVGDVAGKAMPAALYGAMAVGMLRGHVVEGPAEPDAMLAQLNEGLCATGLDDRFLALTFALLDGPRRRIALANGGLPAPFLLHAGRVEPLRLEGLALGIERATPYELRTLELVGGDVLVLGTDGLVESRDAGGELFGVERLALHLRALSDAPAQRIAEGLVRAAAAHAEGNEEQADDRTVVVVKAL